MDREEFKGNSYINIMRKLIMKLFPKLGLQLLYLKTYKKFYNIKNPKTLYEKLIWLNFNSTNVARSMVADKYFVRRYLKDIHLDKYLNKLYGVYNNANEINFEKLPNQFVLKCTHGASYNIICKDKSKLDIPKTIKILNKWLKEDYSLYYAELHYRYIDRKIICEKYLGENIPDYKIYCFNGEPTYVMVCQNRIKNDVEYYFYTFDWEYKHFLKEDLKNPHIKKPTNLKEIYDMSYKLSSEFDFVRVDIYNVDNKIIFGELTITPSGFFDNQTLPKINMEMGEMLDINIK